MTSHYNCKAFEDCQRSIYPKSYFPSTGKEYDAESWFYYLRAISYNPETGTFISPDPIGFRGRNFNLYRYVLNNPTNLIDPTGMFAICVRSPGVLNLIVCTQYKEGSDEAIPLRTSVYEIDPANPPFGIFTIYSDKEFQRLIKQQPQPNRCST